MNKQKTGFFLLTLSLIIVNLATGCNMPSTPTEPPVIPTIDLQPIKTMVAATVWAEVTQMVTKIVPTKTPLPPPTETSEPATPTATEILATVTSTINSGGNKAQFVSQSIPDNTVFAPGARINMVWTLKNAGTTTWTPKYRLKFIYGDSLGSTRSVFLRDNVLPNENVEISIPMVAPNLRGEYRSSWIMADEKNVNFDESVYLHISVERMTPTPKPTATKQP